MQMVGSGTVHVCGKIGAIHCLDVYQWFVYVTLSRMKTSTQKLILTTAFLLISTLCWTQGELHIVDKKVSFGYRTVKNRKITNIIVHSVFNNSGGEKYDIDLIVKQFSTYKVSSHYVIGRDGTVYRFVDESHVAFHAGSSVLPNGKSNINATSIGIEILTAFDESPTEKQLASLVLLVKDIKKRYPIEFLLRHSDIAPSRKTDPWNMDWDAFIKQVQ
jgi:N-acetyl-anhydromuramyl-L-alanine amidase AmpD